MTDFRPYGSKVLVRPLSSEGYSMGAFVVPDTVAEDIPPQQGEVMMVGPRVTRVARGQVVVFGLGIGETIFRDSTPLVFIDEKDVICGIE